MDDTATVRMLPCKRARHIKEMAAFDLYQHFPCHIVMPADDNVSTPVTWTMGILNVATRPVLASGDRPARYLPDNDGTKRPL